jgi:hypothetical protein
LSDGKLAKDNDRLAICELTFVTTEGLRIMTKAIGIASAIGMILCTTIAFADQPVPAPGNSTPGLDRYLDNPGRQQATAVGAQCGSGAGSGAFGYFGKDNNLAGGADGQQTGLNNSAVCGNRQGDLP